jgi:hypothetical protein
VAQYQEALAIIKAGKEMLARCPEADRPGFVPCPEDQRRETKYLRRREAELHSREAIRSGTRLYDPKPDELSPAPEATGSAAGN